MSAQKGCKSTLVNCGETATLWIGHRRAVVLIIFFSRLKNKISSVLFVSSFLFHCFCCSVVLAHRFGTYFTSLRRLYDEINMNIIVCEKWLKYVDIYERTNNYAGYFWSESKYCEDLSFSVCGLVTKLCRRFDVFKDVDIQTLWQQWILWNTYIHP